MRLARTGRITMDNKAGLLVATELSISLGQCSKTGRKEINQDFHGTLVPSGRALTSKGISVLVTDGISSSKVSQIAAESMVKSFLTDYYSTSETWSVKTSAMRVIRAANSWLFAETQRSIHANNMDRGYVCTLSALVLKSRMAHIFHVGDSRIYRLEGVGLEPLTRDHRTVVSSVQSYLARAIGMAATVDIDYRMVPVRAGEIFVLATDGVSEHILPRTISALIRENAENLDAAAREIVLGALENGSKDNLTIQIVRIDTLPEGEASETLRDSEFLPAPPLLEAGQVFEGFKVLRPLHGSPRSHIYLVEDIESGERVVLKIPSINMRDNEDYLNRFMMEDWIARRISSANVMKGVTRNTVRTALYITTEYIEGQTLAQWMTDNPGCDLETMRGIVEQITKGLRAFHRREMLHQDLRPENIMIDTGGTVKIIDFGSVQVAGVQETRSDHAQAEILGTLQYSAPELFVGEIATRQADYFSLGVIAYQMLTGKLPYGTQIAKIRTPAQQRKLKYTPVTNHRPDVPEWVDFVLRKSVSPDPFSRYDALSEFTADLRLPSKAFTPGARRPLAQRNPVVFWQAICVILAAVVVVLLYIIGQGPDHQRW